MVCSEVCPMPALIIEIGMLWFLASFNPKEAFIFLRAVVETMKEKKTKTFSLFNFNKDGKGVEKDEVVGPPTLKNFFKPFFRRFNKLLSLNLLMWFRIPMYLLMLGLVSYLFYSLGGIFEMFFHRELFK